MIFLGDRCALGRESAVVLDEAFANLAARAEHVGPFGRLVTLGLVGELEAYDFEPNRLGERSEIGRRADRLDHGILDIGAEESGELSHVLNRRRRLGGRRLLLLDRLGRRRSDDRRIEQVVDARLGLRRRSGAAGGEEGENDGQNRDFHLGLLLVREKRHR